MKPLKIYVAGPLNAPDSSGYINNLKSMLDAALALIALGHYPYVPCFDILLSIRDADDWVYGDYTRLNLPWVDASDALLLIESSPEAGRELKRAEKLGKIIYRSIEEVPGVSE